MLTDSQYVVIVNELIHGAYPNIDKDELRLRISNLPEAITNHIKVLQVLDTFDNVIPKQLLEHTRRYIEDSIELGVPDTFGEKLHEFLGGIR